MSTPNVPTVTAGRYSLTVRRATSTATVYVDNADAEHVAAEIRGAIADAYHAGRRDAMAEAWRADALDRMTNIDEDRADDLAASHFGTLRPERLLTSTRAAEFRDRHHDDEPTPVRSALWAD